MLRDDVYPTCCSRCNEVRRCCRTRQQRPRQKLLVVGRSHSHMLASSPERGDMEHLLCDYEFIISL